MTAFLAELAQANVLLKQSKKAANTTKLTLKNALIVAHALVLARQKLSFRANKATHSQTSLNGLAQTR